MGSWRTVAGIVQLKAIQSRRRVRNASVQTGSAASIFGAGGLREKVNSIEQYVCPFCLQADALFKVQDDCELIDGWGCHRCNSVQLRNAEYADFPPTAAVPVSTSSAL